MIKNFLLKRSSIVLFVILLISVLLQSANIIIIAVSLCLTYQLILPLTNKKVFDSKIFTSVLVLFCYLILLQCTVLISWLISHNFPLNATPLLMLVLLLAMSIFNKYFSQKKVVSIDHKLPHATFNIKDLVAITVPFMVCGVILIAPLREASGYNTQVLTMSLANGNVDDAAHIAIINDHIQFNRGIQIKSDAVGKTRNGGFYPAGWHSASAVIITSISPNIKVGIESLLAYGIQKLFWFFVMFYLFIRSCFALYALADDRKMKSSSFIMISGLSSLLGCIFLIPIIREGFYSFIPQLIAALLALTILAQVCVEGKLKGPRGSLPLLFIVCIGGCLPWLLPLPAFMAATLLTLYFATKGGTLRESLSGLWAAVKDNAALIIFLGLALLTQLYVMSQNDSTESVSFITGIVQNGGIAKYNEMFYIFACLGFISFLVLCNKHAKKSISALLSLAMTLAFYCIIFYLIQMICVGMITYYFYKVLDILIVFVLPLSIIGIDLLLRKTFDNEHINLGLTVPFTILAFSFLCIGPELKTLSYSGGFREISTNTDVSLYEVLGNELSEENYHKESYVFYYTPTFERGLENELANMIAKTNMYDGKCFNDTRRYIWKTPTIEDLITSIDKKCSGHNVTIVTDNFFQTTFEKAVISKGLQNTITIKSLY